MKHLISVLWLILLSTFFVQQTVYGQAPVCGDDPTCVPDQNWSGYAGMTESRAKPLNARGRDNPTVAMTTLPLAAGKGETIIGSQSFNYVVPILNWPGRAGMDFSLNLSYNSRIWDVDNVNNTITFNGDRDNPSYGFRLDFGFLEHASNGSYILTEADGSKRELVSMGGWNGSTDGTNITLNLHGSFVLTYNNGFSVHYEPIPNKPNLYRPDWRKDANGNMNFIVYVTGHDLAIDAISDSAGRIIHYGYINGELSSIYEFVPQNSSNVFTYATFTWGNQYGDGRRWYNFSPTLTVSSAPTDFNQPIRVLKQCTYANGTGYRFSYGDWGIVNKIERLASDGTTVRSYVSYDFPSADSALSDAPFYTQQTVSPDGGTANTSTWTFAATKAGTGIVTSMDVTDPLGNLTTTTLAPGSGLISSFQVKDNAIPVHTLRTMNYDWTFSGANTVLSGITTTLNDSGQQSRVQYGYDAFSNRSNIKEYDFGLVLKRETAITYLNDSHSLYGIVSLPTQVLVKDGGGTIIERTDMQYDLTSLTPVTGAANHEDGQYTASFLTRGNLTAVTRYANAAAGTGGVTRLFYYDSVGNLRTAQLDCCNQKVFNFSSTTQWTYPDSVVRGPALGPQFTTSATYDYDFGLVTSVTDENGQVTSYQYDNMMRRIKTVLPPQNGTLVELRTDYGDSGQSPTVTNYTANANSTAVTVTTLDGLGHVIQADEKDGATVNSTVKYAYDKLWRRTMASNPFAPTETEFDTTFTYDSLGRTRLITPHSGGSTQFDYSGNTVTITDPAGNQRKYFSDALGRLIEVDEPGYGDALPGQGSVTISGTEQQICTVFFNFCRQWLFDTGSVTITVNGVPKSVNYQQGSTASSVASGLASAINADPGYPATASVSGSTVTLTSKTAGASTNYSLSATSATNDVPDFGVPSFTATPSGANLTGGDDAISPGAPSLSRPIRTTYTYDVVGHLVSANVGAMPAGNQPFSGQGRSWFYDSLGRLITSTTPESGTVFTYYDINGSPCSNDPSLVCRTVDARNITKTFSYDLINRITGVTYSDGTPSVTYAYDAGGAAAFALDRLTSITEGANSQSFTYDNFARITNVDNLIDSNHYNVHYSYNPLGQITDITYPTGRHVSPVYDSIGRTSTVDVNSVHYLKNLVYNAAGQVTNFSFGNDVLGEFHYNDHLQISSLRYYKGTNELLNLGYDYGAANNGQIQTVHYYTTPGSEDLTRSESFTYDAWGRLKQAQTLQVGAIIPYTFKLQWGYDQLGNRLSQALLDGNLPNGVGTPSFTVNTGTNHIDGYCYDLAGNLTDQAACPSPTTPHQYSYDGANRLTGINGANMYTYFGPLRIKKVNGSATTAYIYSGSKPIVEYVNGAVSKEYVYSGSTLLATISGGATTYHHPDHLSNRVETDSTGAPVRTFGHLPYGEVWYEPTGADKLKFTSYERDSAAGETGLDYAAFRYYSPGLGRFMTADLLDGNLTMPQSMNRYSYIVNDPANGIDPLGLCPENDPLCFHIDVWKPFLPENGGVGGLGGTYSPLQDSGPDTRGGGGKRGADLFRCAAQVGNSLSLAALLPKDSNQFLKNALSNDFSTISDLTTGPDRLHAAESVLQGRLTSTAAKAIGDIPVGPAIYKVAENGAGTAFVKDVVRTTLAEKALGKVAGAVLGPLLNAKLAWDGATYLFGLVKCW